MYRRYGSGCLPNVGAGEKLLSGAQYLVALGETVRNIEAWRCEHDLQYEEGLSEDVRNNLFEELGKTSPASNRSLGLSQRSALPTDTTAHSVYASRNQQPKNSSSRAATRAQIRRS